ncbi:MAG: DUF819 family protein [Emcibacteraceae bacterium]|nr:DUF819 family protein [Emcibacteraceae bacterium]
MVQLLLIQPEWHVVLLSVLALLAAFGIWIDTTKLGKSVSGIAAVLIVSMLLSNIGVIPRSAAVYDIVWTYLVPAAIPLLLLKADLRKIIVETKGMLGAFFLGAIGTLIGAVLGFYLLPLGESAHKLAGVFSATYIGGSMNMVAVSQAVGLEPSLTSVSLAADNVVGVIFLIFLSVVPSIAIFRRWFNSSAENANEAPSENIPREEKTIFSLLSVSFALGLTFAICALGNAIAAYFDLSGFSIMFITAITIIIANIFPKQLRLLQGDYELGLLFMYLFFIVIGVSANVAEMLENALLIAVYATLIIVCHTVVIFGGSRFLKLDLIEVIVVSNACVAGPPSAAALAAAKGRRDLVVPAVLLGVFGYVVANFIGVMLFVYLS